jgi:hypothetical protein
MNDYGISLSESSGLCEATSSSCGDREGRVSDTACPSHAVEGCSGLVHELSNLMTTILLNAQMLEWKLPPYSHLKRPVREVARNAQRASELMRRLQQRCGQRSHLSQIEYDPPSLDLDGPATASALTTRSAPENARMAETLPRQTFDLTTGCDRRTSKAFPKRDDSDGQ